jgi:ribonuclease BN (tRNA processing enzyme)
MMTRYIIFILFYGLFSTTANADCGKYGVWLQILGSGGPEIGDKRASSSYAIWHDGKAKILVDIGSGSMLQFERSSADINTVEVILLSHLHVDHTADLPTLIKATFFTDRAQDLPVFGPSGNAAMPSTSTFIETLFGKNGAYRYLSNYTNGADSYTIRPHDINIENKQAQSVLKNDLYQLTAVATHHGPIPALAWKINIAGKSIVFSGDMNNDNSVLAELANNADILVAHHAIPEDSKGVARDLHMPPSIIGEIAQQANVKKLVLSHLMQRTLGQTIHSEKQIRKKYAGSLYFAKDLQCFKP